LIIYQANKFTRAQQAVAASTTLFDIGRQKRKTQMTRTILFITFFYVITSLPGIVQAGYFYNPLIALEAGQMITSLINSIQFSYPAFNFFLLFFSNKLFANEIKALFHNFIVNKVHARNNVSN